MPTQFLITAPRTIEFREYEEKPLQPDEIRIRALVSGIKHGTEMALYRGKTPFLDRRFDPDYRLFMPREENTSFYPINVGSWLVGEVIETGSAVTRFKVGDRVHGEMSHRPTNVRPESTVFPLKSGMKPELAVGTDPAIFALTAVHDAQVKVGDRVVVFGLGALGLLAIQIARLNGAEQVFAVDLIEKRRELALELGADAAFNPTDGDVALAIKDQTGTKGVDVAIEISGAYPALQSAIRSIQPGGTIVAASYYGGNAQLELGAEWHHNRPTLISSMPVWGMPHRCAPLWDLKRVQETALRLIESGRLQVEPLLTHRYAYDEAAAAYAFIDSHPEQTIKTLLDYPA